MRAKWKAGRTKLVSFSGIDGAGKSTQIEALLKQLEQNGRTVVLFRFWDDIAMLTRLREATGHTLFKGDEGIGTPDAPIERRDKNVTSWAMTGVRLFIYFLDAISARRAVKKAMCSEADLAIFDRYTYDELANLELSNPAIRIYVHLIMTLVPRPDISYLLDADPEKARARKPEYPLEFLRANRKSYLDLSKLVGGMTVIDPLPVCDVRSAVLKHAIEGLTFRASPHTCGASKANDSAGSEIATLDGPKN
jgi:thymidylate kinase